MCLKSTLPNCPQGAHCPCYGDSHILVNVWQTELRTTSLPQNTVWLFACSLTLSSCGQYSRKRKIFRFLLMCESPLYLCVPLTRSAPGFCRQLCFAGHQTICSADLIFNSFCVFIGVGNQWVKRKIGEFEKNISEIRAPWTWEPYSFLPSASASKPILAAWNSNQIVGKPWTA